jgi:hypothetical protein
MKERIEEIQRAAESDPIDFQTTPRSAIAAEAGLSILKEKQNLAKEALEIIKKQHEIIDKIKHCMKRMRETELCSNECHCQNCITIRATKDIINNGLLAFEEIIKEMEENDEE